MLRACSRPNLPYRFEQRKYQYSAFSLPLKLPPSSLKVDFLRSAFLAGSDRAGRKRSESWKDHRLVLTLNDITNVVLDD